MNDENSERRITTPEIREIAHSYHRIETRVAVLETRINTQDHRLSVIEMDIRTIKAGVERVLDSLAAHVRQQDRDRIKLMAGIITILLTVLGFFGTFFVDRFFPK